jgi:hypothetical protein
VAYQSLMNITILLLVSDPIVRSILKETLEHEGYTVVFIRPTVPGLCHQLRASRLPRSLVRAIETFPVPLPWRRLLCRRISRIRSTPARAVRVQAQNLGRQIDDQRGRDADPCYRGLREASPHSTQAPSPSMSKLKQRGIEVYNWIERRLGLAKPIADAAEHPIPAAAQAGGMFSAAPPPCCLDCKWSPAFCSRWSTFPRPAKLGTASSSSITTLPWAGFCGPSMAGLELHDCHCAHPHGTGFSFWSP